MNFATRASTPVVLCVPLLPVSPAVPAAVGPSARSGAFENTGEISGEDNPSTPTVVAGILTVPLLGICLVTVAPKARLEVKQAKLRINANPLKFRFIFFSKNDHF
ncbi:hypothetical protein [Collimonas fungivorans]|uniref:hypothetical protein n=1 Tax=Collimonas fungivorans TaxID=158899 RepID=UPI0026ED2958|nr:hypothetical protein [Collimonas fungivorans]